MRLRPPGTASGSTSITVAPRERPISTSDAAGWTTPDVPTTSTTCARDTGVDRQVEDLFRQRLAEPHDARALERAAPGAAREPLDGLVDRAPASHSVQRTSPSEPWSSIGSVLPARACRPSTVWVTSVRPGRRPLELDQRAVAGVRLGRGDQPLAPRVPLPDEPRIDGERLGRCEVLGAERAPDPARAAERRNAALGRDAGAGEDGDVSAWARALLQV